jgi:hypothetical protein
MDINIGDVAKPVTALIKKISNAAGILFEPYQVVRLAKVEAERELIRAESQIKTTDLHRRAFSRFLDEEAKKQRNIEEIIQCALPQVVGKSRPDQVEDDWLTNFFDKCRLISDAEMQTLWSRILAGEANDPGSYSKRTVNSLASMDKSDAYLFTKLGTFAWTIGEVTPLIYDPVNELYARHDITTVSLKHLESIGLIEFNELRPFTISYKNKTGMPIKLTVLYYEEPIQIELSGQSGYILGVGHVRLTQVGQELAPICGSTPDDEFRNYVVTKWKEWGYITEETTEN